MTLYHFANDRRDSGKTACYGDCTKVWTPYTDQSARRKPGNCIRQDVMLGTIKRKRRDDPGDLRRICRCTLYASDPAASTGGAGLDSFGGYWYPVGVDGRDAKE